MLTAALASVDEATEDVRDETRKRGKAVAAALKGEIEAPQKKHRGRKLLVLLGLGGLGFAAYKKFGGKQPTTTWQSSYTPPPAPTPPPAGGPVAGEGAHRADATPDDSAASDPAEAASDATDVPHDATTPDKPVEEIDVTQEVGHARFGPGHREVAGAVCCPGLRPRRGGGGSAAAGRPAGAPRPRCRSAPTRSRATRSARPGRRGSPRGAPATSA